MAARVLVVGDLVTDVLVLLDEPVRPGTDTPARIRFTGGGQGANTAAWLARAGVDVALAATVGDDDAGRARTAELAAAGVTTTAVRASPDHPTGTIVVLAGDGDRAMLADRGATYDLRPADVDAALDAAPFTHLHLSGYTFFTPQTLPAARHAVSAARSRGLTTSVDAASAAPLTTVGPATFLDWIRPVDLLLANEDEARILTGPSDPSDAALRLTATAAAAVVKLGADGAVWAGGDGRVFRTAAERVELVDATGAGDAFAAGLLAAWLAGAGPQEALRAGARLGAEAVTRAGARP